MEWQSLPMGVMPLVDSVMGSHAVRENKTIRLIGAIENASMKWGIEAFLACAIAMPPMGGALANDTQRYLKPSDYTSSRDWFLQGENIRPHGHNSFYFPLVPGHKHILELADISGEKIRMETMVLDQTEPFDIDGIGKFEAAIVQDDEYVDEEPVFRVHRWVAIDKSTNSVHIFGEVRWEINDQGRAIVEDTWRAGEAEENRVARPGLLMPGIFTIGARFLVGGRDDKSSGGFEAVEAGIEVAVPAGTFGNCVRLREQGLLEVNKDFIDRIWCPQVGLVSATSSGQLIASNALPSTHPGSDVSSFGKYAAGTQVRPPPIPKISSEEAQEKALKVVPGRVTSVVIERKRGKHVYVVEILTRNASEKDVLVDVETGEVVGTE